MANIKSTKGLIPGRIVIDAANAIKTRWLDLWDEWAAAMDGVNSVSEEEGKARLQPIADKVFGLIRVNGYLPAVREEFSPCDQLVILCLEERGLRSFNPYSPDSNVFRHP